MADCCASKIEASRSVYYSLTDDVPGLTEEEKQKLEAVMKKAQDFEVEEANKMRQPVEGQLYKYTNVMKGWQYRWFILTPDTAMLEYYMPEERKKSRPRGGINLAGAVVTPSEEDNQSFSVSALCGEIFKLKASDTKDRQFWVDRIRSVIEKCVPEEPAFTPETDCQTMAAQSAFVFCKSNSTFHVGEEKCPASPSHAACEKSLSTSSEKPPETSLDPIIEIKNAVYKAVACQKNLAKSIEDLPFSGPSIKCSDPKLLLIKATSQATVQSIEQCFLILRRCRQREAIKSNNPVVVTSTESLDKSKSNMKRQT